MNKNMKKYVKPIVRMIEFEHMDLMAGSQPVDETPVGNRYHAKSASAEDWE